MKKEPKNAKEPQEPTEELVFQQYVKGLELTSEDFKKRILDVGSNSAQFSKWAQDHNISDQIYSIDPTERLPFKEKTKAVRGRAQELPFKDEAFDLVISHAAIPQIFSKEKNLEKLEWNVAKSLQEMIRVVKDGGEVRISRFMKGQVFQGQKNVRDAFDKVVDDLQKSENITIEEIQKGQADFGRGRIEPVYLIKIKKRKSPKPPLDQTKKF